MTDKKINLTTTTNPFLFKASPSDAVKEYAKTSSVWLRNLSESTIAERENRREKVGKTASKWLNDVLETKYDVMA